MTFLEPRDKVAFLTGGTGALGATLCRIMAGAGVRLFLTYRDPSLLAATLEQLPAGSEARHSPADVTKEAEVSRTVAQAIEEYGRIDILCNLAGGFLPGAPLWQTSPTAWDALMDTNARSAYLTMRAVLPHMLERNEGKIVNVSARTAATRPPRQSAYAASKDAVALITEIVAKELHEYNICVNAVAPSIIDTPANRRAMPEADFSRWATREQVAEVILFLCSPRAEGVRGAVVPVNGRV
ncbi:MAG: SDR family NAD(P)-dependent oxidoreductase [Pseudomonadota bacterium]